MKRFSWLVAGAVAGIALMLACEMQSDPSGGGASVAPGGSAHADETDGVQRLMTAETDPAQQIDGRLPDGIGEIVDGPAFVTDLRRAFGSEECIISIVKSGEPCNKDIEDAVLMLSHQANSASSAVLTGARIFVPEGSTLCSTAAFTSFCGRLSWSGYRPYE